MADRTPFIVYEAEVALFHEGADTAAGPFLGGCAEKVEMDYAIRERILEYHGRPNGLAHAADTEHAVEVQNLWLRDADEGLPAPFAPNGRYLLVIVWRDLEADAWAKRTYVGVTGRGQRLDSGGAGTPQTLRYRAEDFQETSGDGAVTTTPDLLASVRYAPDPRAGRRVLTYVH